MTATDGSPATTRESGRVNLELRHAWVKGTQSKNRHPTSVPANDVAPAVLVRHVGKHRERVFTFRGRAQLGQHESLAYGP